MPIDPAYRAEFNTRDQRAATFNGSGFKISFGTDAPYPSAILLIEKEDGGRFTELLPCGHLGFGKFLSEYEFDTVLEIGARGGIAARAMEFVGKNVLTVEVMPEFGARYVGDYLDVEMHDTIDAIWCSHVFEHQRHPGKFLEKCFDDLREGGTLALTVPTALQPLLIGHHNIFTPMLLLYQLILAGFDCADAIMKSYDQQMTIIVKKIPNNIPRLSFASTMMDSPGKLGQVDNLVNFFPASVRDGIATNGVAWGEVEVIGW